MSERPLNLLDQSKKRQRARPGPDTDDDTGPDDHDDEGQLLCARCHHPVTHVRDRIERGGAHEHGRINPSGYSFHLACYANAPGATAYGPPSTEHSWFAGHAWRIALCGSCGEQLGWRFEDGGGDTFFGLIVSRLVPWRSRKH